MKIVYKDDYVAVSVKKRKNKINYTFVKFRSSVVIVAITNTNKVLLVKQYRAPLQKEILEIPAGGKDKGDETALQTAKRELLEETGYSAKTWIELGRFSMEPNIVTTQPVVFLCVGATCKSQLKIEEKIKHKEYSWEEIEELIKKKQLTDSFTIAALYAAKLHLK